MSKVFLEVPSLFICCHGWSVEVKTKYMVFLDSNLRDLHYILSETRSGQYLLLLFVKCKSFDNLCDPPDCVGVIKCDHYGLTLLARDDYTFVSHNTIPPVWGQI